MKKNILMLLALFIGLVDLGFQFEVKKLHGKPFCFANSNFIRKIEHKHVCPNRVDFVRTKPSQRYFVLVGYFEDFDKLFGPMFTPSREF